jgi:YidC/Oxa1 family membrane protein insertase
MNYIKPQAGLIQNKMREQLRLQDKLGVQQTRAEMKALQQSVGASVGRSFFGFGTAVLGFGFWRLIHNMTLLPVPGLETGGALWFSNLVLPDPYFILPAALAVTTHLMFRVSFVAWAFW